MRGLAIVRVIYGEDMHRLINQNLLLRESDPVQRPISHVTEKGKRRSPSKYPERSYVTKQASELYEVSGSKGLNVVGRKGQI